MLSFTLCIVPANYVFGVVIFVSIVHSSVEITVEPNTAQVEASTNRITTADDKKLSNYEFAYKITHDEGAEQGHKRSVEGSKSSGEYYVNLAGGEKTSVNYYADEQGYHPHFSFKSGSSQSHFKFGDHVKPLVRNNSSSDKYEINIESQSGKLINDNYNNTEKYSSSPFPIFSFLSSSTESLLSNEVNTALPSSVTETLAKVSRSDTPTYITSDTTSSSTESTQYDSSIASQMNHYTSSVTTPNYDRVESASSWHTKIDPYLSQSPLFVPSAEIEELSSETYSDSSEKYHSSSEIYTPSSDSYTQSSESYTQPSERYSEPSTEKYSPSSEKYIASSERYVSSSTEKPAMKVYPSTPGVQTTLPNVFYVNAQSNFNSSSTVLSGFENYLKDYLNANEVKSNDIDSNNIRVISDKNELDKLIKNAGNEYEIVKLSDIMAEKKRKQNEKLTSSGSTTPGYLQVQNSYTQIPSTYNTESTDTTSRAVTLNTIRNANEQLGLMKYYEVANAQDVSVDASKNTNSFLDQRVEPDSANSDVSNSKSFASNLFSPNFGQKISTSNSIPTLFTKEPSYSTTFSDQKVSFSSGQPSSSYTLEPVYNTANLRSNDQISNIVPSTEKYTRSEQSIENYRVSHENNNESGRVLKTENQFNYYEKSNGESQEQIYFKELQSQNENILKPDGQVYPNQIPLQLLKVPNEKEFFDRLQNGNNQNVLYNQIPINNQIPIVQNQPDLSSYSVIPLGYTVQQNLIQYQTVPAGYQLNSNSIVSSTEASLYDKPIIVAEVNNTIQASAIVSRSNGETGHMVKNYDSFSTTQNIGSESTTASDLEVAKVEQLNPNTPKNVSKKDIDNNKLDYGSFEKQQLHEMPSYTTTIEVFKSVPVEQYEIPDIEDGSKRDINLYKPLLADKTNYYQYQNLQVPPQHPQIQLTQQNGNPYPNIERPRYQKTRLQPVFISQPQSNSFYKSNVNYFNNEQKYYTDQLRDTKAPFVNQAPVPIPLNYGLKEVQSGLLSYRTPLSHQLKSIQQYGVPQYSVFTNPIDQSSMSVVHPSYSISVNPLPLNQIQQQMVSNSIPYASQFYPHYIPSDSNNSHPNSINTNPPVYSRPNDNYQTIKSISSEIAGPYSYPKPIHNPFEYPPAKPAYNHKTRLVPAAQHFHIPTTILHLVRTPYKSTLSKLKSKYNPNESYYVKEMYNYAPQYEKENYHFDGQHPPQQSENIHYDGRAKNVPFRPSFPAYDSVYPPMQYYETQFMAPNNPNPINNNQNNNNYRRPYIRSIQRPVRSGNMKKLCVEYGGFKPPMVPSTEIKDDDVQTQVTEK